MTSLCDKCRLPGRCCSGFGVNDRYNRLTTLEVLADLVSIDKNSTGNWLGLPFVPLYRTPKGKWLLWCPLLDSNGRCSIYEDRPMYPCVDYKPGQDLLCVMHDKNVIEDQS